MAFCLLSRLSCHATQFSVYSCRASRFHARALCVESSPSARNGPGTKLQATVPNFVRSMSSGGRWFDRIIPDDDPETKFQKEKEREVVLKRLNRSIFAELRAAPNEKVVSISELLPAVSAVTFPSCTALPISRDDKDLPLLLPSVFLNSRVSLVSISFQALGQTQLKKWMGLFLEAFRPEPLSNLSSAKSSCRGTNSTYNGAALNPAVLHVLYLEGYFFNMLRRLFIRSSKKALQASEHPFHAIAFQPSDKETDVRYYYF